MTHSNSVAVVTGSARNIGRATALKLGELGFSVVAHTNNDDENLQQTADQVRQIGMECATVVGSLDNPDTVIALDRACKTLGNCRVLVNNASIRKTKPFLEMTLEEWRQVFHINSDAQFMCTQQFLPDMLKSKWGRVICLGGLSAHTGAQERAAVVSSKSSVPGLVRALAVEFADSGVTFNCVVPGHIDTHRTAETGARLKHPSFDGKNVPYGQPTDIAAVIAMLVGPDSGFITGQTIHVNGGAFLP